MGYVRNEDERKNGLVWRASEFSAEEVRRAVQAFMEIHSNHNVRVRVIDDSEPAIFDMFCFKCAYGQDASYQE